MRIIRVKPSNEVKKYIAVLAKRYGIKDSGLVADIYGLVRFKGRGLPTEERLTKMAEVLAKKINQPEMLVGLLLKKRLIALKNVIATPVFAGIISEDLDPMDGVEKVLSIFTELHTKKQAYQCKGCKYNAQCGFAAKYANLVTDIAKVRDTDYKKEVHPDCPALPELDFVNSIEESRKFFDNLMDEESEPESELAKQSHQDQAKELQYFQNNQGLQENIIDLEGLGGTDDSEKPDDLTLGDIDEFEDFQEFADLQSGGYARGNRASIYKFDGRYCISVCQSLVKDLSDADFAMFDIARKLDFLLDHHKKGKFRPTEELGRDKGQENVKKVSDAPKVLPSEHVHDDEEFFTRLSKKSLMKRQEKNPEQKRALMYVLVDSSGSMFTGVTSKLAFLSRFNTARVFTLALARRMKKENGIMYWRAFSDYPGHRFLMDSAQTYTEFGNRITKMSPIMGGTDIELCLKTAMDDIHAAKDNLSKAEILLITDCEDHIDQQALENQLKRWPTNILHTLDVSGKGKSGSRWGNASEVLKKISNQYFYVDPKAGLDLEKMVALI